MHRILVGAVLGLLTACGIGFVGTYKPVTHTYPTLLQVVSCEGTVQDGFTVRLRNCHGFVYTVTWEDGDMDTGDFYTCIMDDNGTSCIYDDIVIYAKYERVDLF